MVAHRPFRRFGGRAAATRRAVDRACRRTWRSRRKEQQMNEVIEARELRKQFTSRRGPVKAVRGVSFDISQGEIFGFLGPNGAGKTTTLRMLTTLLPIDSGTATVAGLD